ncbi:hypothetical protein DPMN_070078 [Dreissena polymorpha]|uniref:Uncharacterized protein n=1 Tax=Dreissena polymorpha TaxID=45954 RepID=A0A9D3Z4F4_DREPO|nr:hypothetical protein DPMN_070078 [Dreissena polymorpha]
MLIADKQCLITKLECEDGVSEEQGKEFMSGEAIKDEESAGEESAEELVSCLP